MYAHKDLTFQVYFLIVMDETVMTGQTERRIFEYNLH